MEIKDLTYIKRNKTLINKINIKIKENQITGFIGTHEIYNLLEIISKKKQPTSGQIIYSAKKIAINQQKFTKQTVKEEIGSKVQHKEKKIKDSLKLVGLNEKHLYLNPQNLSSGEQQLLSLAITFASNPKIIILNEPTKNLDTKNKEYIIKLLKLMELRYKKTIIINTKDTNILLALANEIYLFDSGNIIKYGDKYEILSNKQLLSKYNIDSPNLIEFSQIVKEKTNKNIGYRNDINDLIKDIYRNIT